MRIRLTTQFTAIIVCVLMVTLSNSFFGLYSASSLRESSRTIVEKNLESVIAAEELEIALLEQRGYASLYVLDGGDPQWLVELDDKSRQFRVRLDQAQNAAHSDTARRTLDKLETVNEEYARLRDEAVAAFDHGNSETARRMLVEDVVVAYTAAYDLCEAFLAENYENVKELNGKIQRQLDWMIGAVSALTVITFALSAILLWLLFQSVLLPLRRMAADARLFQSNIGPNGNSSDAEDELREVGRYLRLFMSDVAETRSDLQRSRAQLAHAEKLVAVGKLAANVAHEIRNPLTAVKMWLFSIRRAAAPELGPKFELVSEEITRLESIVRNFLEFARPPRIQLRRVDMEVLVNKSVELLRHRLQESAVIVDMEFPPELPNVMGDEDQLRQVMINLIANSIDAMPDGGVIRFRAATGERVGRRMVVIRIADQGQGIDPEAQRRIFEPFFSTKPNGVGLGLSITATVMTRHDGALILESSGPNGTIFALWMPIFEEYQS